MPCTTRYAAMLAVVVLLLSAGAPVLATATEGTATGQHAPQDTDDVRRTVASGAAAAPAVLDGEVRHVVGSESAYATLGFVSDDGNPIPVLLLLGYSRYDDSSPLDNDVRRRVFQQIERSPGVHVSALADLTDASRSTVRYHVRVLEREGLVYDEKIRGKRRYFPVGSEAPELLAALSDDATASVLDAVSRIGPANVSQLADDLDRTPGTVSYHLSRLETAGLVEQERDGGAVLTRLADPARAHLHDGLIEQAGLADD